MTKDDVDISPYEKELGRVRNQIAVLMQPPFDVEDNPVLAPFEEAVTELWISFVRDFPEQVDGEGHNVEWCIHPTEDRLAYEVDLRRLKANLYNLRTWIGKARRELKATFGHLFRFDVKLATDRPKHWQRKKVTDADVLVASRDSNDSWFFTWFNEQMLYDVFWSLLAKHIKEFSDKSTTTFYVDFERFVGALKGEPCSVVVYKVDYSTPEVHGYLELHSALPAGQVVHRVSDFQFEWILGVAARKKQK